MSETPSFKYRRLPGSGRRQDSFFNGKGARHTLWLGPDHVLSLHRIWASEEYKRFYFRDIQAITVQKNKRSTVWTFVFSSFLFLNLLLFGFLVNDRQGDGRTDLMTFGGIMAGLFLVMLIVNLVRGTSCTTRLHTAVQTEILSALGRRPVALKTLRILQPLILETQGELNLETHQQHSTALPTAPLTPGVRPATGRAGDPSLQPAKPTRAGLHLAFYLALLAAGASDFFGAFLAAHPAWAIASVFLHFAVVILSFSTLVAQRGTNITAGLRRVTTGTFVGVLLAMVTVAGFFYAHQINVAMQQTYPRRALGGLSLYSMPGFSMVMIVGACLGVAAGCTGLALTLLYRSRSAIAAEPSLSGPPLVPPPHSAGEAAAATEPPPADLS